MHSVLINYGSFSLPRMSCDGNYGWVLLGSQVDKTAVPHTAQGIFVHLIGLQTSCILQFILLQHKLPLYTSGLTFFICLSQYALGEHSGQMSLHPVGF